MTTRRASCSCGQLHLDCTGAPLRISVCHCLECQKRTGSAFGAAARFASTQIGGIEGRVAEFVRVGDEGLSITFRFCPVCGSTVYYTMNGKEPPFTPDYVAVALGAFADPTFPAPTASVYEDRRHPWAVIEGAIRRYD